MKKIIAILLTIFIAFSSTSCRGTKQEIEKLAVVVAIGMDLTEDNKYMASVQILNPQSQSSSSMGAQSKEGGQQNSKEVLVYSAIGDSPVDALNNISKVLGKNLFFSHDKFIVLGKELTESGLAQFIDSALRAYDTRPDSTLLVTKGKALDIITAASADEKIPTNSIDQLIKLQYLKGFAPKVSRMDFANALTSKTASPIIGVINLNKKNYVGATFNLEGTAVFKKDKLIGYLDTNATRGMMWIKGKVKDGYLTADLSDNGKISFQILKSDSKINAIQQGDNVTIMITIQEESNIYEMQGEFDPMKNHKEMDKLSELQNEAIKKEVEYALYTAQKDLKADIFDFGGIIHRTYPKTWKKLEKNWEDIFPDIDVEVKVNSTLKGPGIISKPMK